MTLIVGVDTYLNITDADTYWSKRNNDVWSNASDADKEKALREATQYLDGAYEFIGSHKDGNVLAFPRYDVVVQRGNFRGEYYDSDTIPPQIKNACAELAIEALSARLVEVQDRGGLVKRERVDVIEVEYLDFAPSTRSFKFVTMLLRPLIKSGKNSRRLVRT